MTPDITPAVWNSCMGWQRTFPLARLLRLIAGVSVSCGVLRYVAEPPGMYWSNSVLWWLQIGCGLMMTAAALFNTQPERQLHWLALMWLFGCLHEVQCIQGAFQFLGSHDLSNLSALIAERIVEDLPTNLAVPLCLRR